MFTAENAAMFARKSHAPESARHRKKLADNSVASAVQEIADPLASKLARVQDELATKMAGNGNPTEISKLARALRDVRETFHLITGQAKPGVIKPGRERQSRHSPAPEPESDVPQKLNPPDPGPSVNGNVT